MANTCCTEYRFYGTREAVASFRHKLLEWTEWDSLPNNADARDLTNILTCAGLQDKIPANGAGVFEQFASGGAYRCEGEVSGIEDVAEHKDGNVRFSVFTETAWEPMPEMWQGILDKLALDIKFAYRADEGGNDLYIVSDPHKFGDFDSCQLCLDFDIADEDAELRSRFKSCAINEECGEFSTTIEDVTRWLQALIQTTDTDIDKLIEQAENFHFSSRNSYVKVGTYQRR